jgi:ABC-type sugar transport system substrate-binding protein
MESGTVGKIALAAYVLAIVVYTIMLVKSANKLRYRIAIFAGVGLLLCVIYAGVDRIAQLIGAQVVPIIPIAVILIIASLLIIVYHRRTNMLSQELKACKTSVETLGVELAQERANLKSANQELTESKTSVQTLKIELAREKTNLQKANQELTAARASVQILDVKLEQEKANVQRTYQELTATKGSAQALEIEFAKEKAKLQKLKKNIAVFVPRSVEAQNSFWLEYVHFVMHALQKHECYAVVEYLETDYSADEQISMLKAYNWSTVEGAIVSLADATVLPELAHIMVQRANSGPPIVLHDLSPDVANDCFAKLSIPANLVCVDNATGGAMAADIMLDYFTTRSLTPPYEIVVVPGSHKHPHSRARIDGFRKRIQERGMQAQFYETNEGNWTAEGAAEVIDAFIANMATSKFPIVHGVFVCNDDMAIGVENVLASTTSSVFKDTVVVGFDYTYLLRELWRSRQRSMMVGTVDAQVHLQANLAVGLILELIRDQKAYIPVKRVPPKRIQKTGPMAATVPSAKI